VQIKVDWIESHFMDTTTAPFASGFPLHELPDLTEEVFFAYHLKINKIIYLNPAFERVWDIPRESVGCNLSLLFSSVHPDDRSHVKASFAALITDGLKQEIEFRIVLLTTKKNQKWIRVNAYTAEKGNKEIIVGIATDITGDKDYNDTLHRFSDKKNSILQILSHDLLGPLGNIDLSTTMLLQDDKLNGDESLTELINLIKRNSKKSVTMIRDLINDEFLQSSEASLQKQRVNIVGNIRQLLDQYQQSPLTVPPQRFNLVTSLESLFITVDESKFMQVITNLLSNALKFTPDTGNIEIIVEELEKNVLIKVKDNGIGIPADKQPFLFDKFTKARRQGIHGEPSTGLGMSIIKRIIEWHQGRIWFESTEGNGTTFFIEIPKDG
jgi:two-component system sensor histidine kinase VicK